MEQLHHLTDEHIIDLVRKGNQETYREIVLRYEKKLSRYANYLLRDTSSATDVVQDSFIKAFINLNGFNSKKKFSTWIYRIVHNEAMNALAKSKRVVPIEDSMDWSADDDIVNDVSTEELKRMVQSCLSKLPIIYSEPLSLYYFEEKSYEEISDILRLPINTVGTRVSRAKILMKKICQSKK